MSTLHTFLLTSLIINIIKMYIHAQLIATYYKNFLERRSDTRCQIVIEVHNHLGWSSLSTNADNLSVGPETPEIMGLPTGVGLCIFVRV